MTSASRSNCVQLDCDGARLVFDVFLPERMDGPFVTVVTRTPYGRSAHRAEGEGWAQRGFAFVIADVRGRYDSDGEWQPYRSERRDGAALADWIVMQSWSDGQLVAYGGSYSGYTAWALAAERPHLVAAIVSVGPSMSLARTKFSPSGVLRLAEHAAWWAERADSRTSRDGYSARFFARHPEALLHLPVVELDLGVDLPGWADVVRAGPGATNGEEITDEDVTRIGAPSFHIGGWHDLLVGEALRLWALRSAASSAPSHLMIGPWEHDLVFARTGQVGAVDYGPSAVRDWGRELVVWIRSALNGTLSPRSTTIFVRGSRRWCTATDWPPTTANRTYWLDDGALSTRQPTRAVAPVRFRTDQADPFPSLPEGHDRAAVETRTDAIRLELAAAPLASRIAGRPVVCFYGSSDSGCADWIARLVQVHDNGRIEELTRGETATGFGMERVEIVLDPVDVAVDAAALLRLEITGADFPRLARNLGVPGVARYTNATCPTIVQEVHPDNIAPLLTLPIVVEDASSAAGGAVTVAVR